MLIIEIGSLKWTHGFVTPICFQWLSSMHLKSFAKGIMLEMYTTIEDIDYWAIEAHDVIVVKHVVFITLII